MVHSLGDVVMDERWTDGTHKWIDRIHQNTVVARPPPEITRRIWQNGAPYDDRISLATEMNINAIRRGSE